MEDSVSKLISKIESFKGVNYFVSELYDFKDKIVAYVVTKNFLEGIDLNNDLMYPIVIWDKHQFSMRVGGKKETKEINACVRDMTPFFSRAIKTSDRDERIKRIKSNGVVFFEDIVSLTLLDENSASLCILYEDDYVEFMSTDPEEISMLEVFFTEFNIPFKKLLVDNKVLLDKKYFGDEF